MQHSVFVVALFRPGIRKEHEDALKRVLRGQRSQPFIEVAPHKVEVLEGAFVTFVQGLADALADEVYADAACLRMRLSVGGQKMSVPATGFKRQPFG